METPLTVPDWIKVIETEKPAYYTLSFEQKAERKALEKQVELWYWANQKQEWYRRLHGRTASFVRWSFQETIRCATLLEMPYNLCQALAVPIAEDYVEAYRTYEKSILELRDKIEENNAAVRASVVSQTPNPKA